MNKLGEKKLLKAMTISSEALIRKLMNKVSIEVIKIFL